MEESSDKKKKILKGASYVGAAGVGAMAQKAFSSNSGAVADDVVEATVEETPESVEEVPVAAVEHPVHAGSAAAPEGFMDNADVVGSPEASHTNINININTGDHAEHASSFAGAHAATAFSSSEAPAVPATAFSSVETPAASATAFSSSDAQAVSFANVHTEPVLSEPVPEPIIAEPAPEPAVVHTPVMPDPVETAHPTASYHEPQVLNVQEPEPSIVASTAGDDNQVSISNTGDELNGSGNIMGSGNTMVGGNVTYGNVYNGPVTIVQNTNSGNTSYNNSGNRIDNSDHSINNSGNSDSHNISNSGNSDSHNISDSGNSDSHNQTSWYNEEQHGQFAGHDIDTSTHIEPMTAHDAPFDESHSGLFQPSIGYAYNDDPSAVPDFHESYDQNDFCADNMGDMDDMSGMDDFGGMDDMMV